MKIGKFNLKPTTLLGVAITGLGVLTSVLSGKADELARKDMKAELKDEIIKDLLKNDNN